MISKLPLPSRSLCRALVMRFLCAVHRQSLLQRTQQCAVRMTGVIHCCTLINRVKWIPEKCMLNLKQLNQVTRTMRISLPFFLRHLLASHTHTEAIDTLIHIHIGCDYKSAYRKRSNSTHTYTKLWTLYGCCGFLKCYLETLQHNSLLRNRSPHGQEACDHIVKMSHAQNLNLKNNLRNLNLKNNPKNLIPSLIIILTLKHNNNVGQFQDTIM